MLKHRSNAACRHIPLLIVAVVLAILPDAQAQSVSYSNTLTVFSGPGTTYLSLSKFDSSLGTLSGVELKINFSRVGGSFLVTNSSGSVDVTSATMNASIFGFGIPSWTAYGFNLVSTPGLPYSGVAADSAQTFTVTTANVWSNEIANVDSLFWSDHEAPGGGTVNFPIFSTSEVTISDTNFASANPAGISLETEMVVTYTFVPEPSTYALLLMSGILSAFCVKRRLNQQR